jgi:predicted XRE-type DNA-binding protein
MSPKLFVNVWDAIEGTPAKAAEMKMRSELLAAIQKHLAKLDMDLAAVSKLTDVPPSDLAQLLQGKISQFGLDELIDTATKFGLKIEMSILDPTLHDHIKPESGRQIGILKAQLNVTADIDDGDSEIADLFCISKENNEPQ